MFGRKKKGPKTKAGKVFAEAMERKCSKPKADGSRCEKKLNHLGKC